jgi:hypothetical protein
VTSIGEKAFAGCAALKSVVIPASVTEIQDYAFGYDLDSSRNCVKISDFKIHGYTGTAAETYATENGFTFEGHTWNDGEVTTAATCTTDGVKTYSCTACGETKTETIEKLGHDYVATVTEPTCTAEGYTTHTCSRCGNSYVDTKVAATGHSWNDGEVTKAATCTEDGVKTYTCTACGETKTETIEKLGHDYVATVTDPTCTAEGYTTYTCSRCENSYVDTKVAATGHSWNDGEVTKAATCTEDGVKTYTCTACSETKTETIAKLGHNYVATVTDPTCTAEGYTTYTCSRCENSYVDTKVAATDHDWNDGKVTKSATCTENGVKTYTCQNCGETKTETIEKLGHNYVATVTDPTCTAEGYTTHTCSRCGRYYVDETVVATAHNWDDGVVTKPATASETGILTYTCANCGETKTEKIDYQRIPGDINDDGKVDTNDLVRLMKMISENAQYTYLDINGDGKVDTNDLIRLMKYLTDKTVEIH